MNDAEYESLKERLLSDFWAFIGHKAASITMFLLEHLLKLSAFAWPLIIAWLRKNGYLDV